MGRTRVTMGMATIIGDIAERHGVDLARVGSRLVLDNDPWQPLTIHVLDRSVVLVAHYREDIYGDVPDPEGTYYVPTFGWIAPGTRHSWLPVGLRQAVGLETLATLVLGGEVVLAVPHLQVQLASFAELWARNLRDQRYLEDGVPRAEDEDEE